MSGYRTIRPVCVLLAFSLIAASFLFFCGTQTAEAAGAGVKAVAAGKDFSLIIKEDNTLWACGNNSNGQFGNGTYDNSTAPVKVMDGVIGAAAGKDFSLILKSDNTLWACGSNSFGQLGDKTYVSTAEPVKVMDNVRAVAAGPNYSLAIKKDNSLWAWGNNTYGQFGNGKNTGSEYPSQVLTNVSQVAAGINHVLAVKADGTLWAWGNNGKGQLGTGNYNPSFVPVKVMDKVKAAAAGNDYSLAVKTDGTLWAWGNNVSGQLGDGTTTAVTLPKKVMTDVIGAVSGSGYTDSETNTSGTSISTKRGGMVSFAIKKDNSLWAFGNNSYGQLGNGTETNSLLPIKIMDNVKTAALGSFHALAVKNDKTVYAWGKNNYGQLGINTTDNANKPCSLAMSAAAAAINVNVMIQDSLTIFQQRPVMESGSILVPADEMMKALGAQVTADSKTGTAEGVLGGTTIKVAAGSKTAWVNGKAAALTVPAKLVNGKVMVPIRFIGENFGMSVYWNKTTSTVMLYKIKN